MHFVLESNGLLHLAERPSYYLLFVLLWLLLDVLVLCLCDSGFLYAFDVVIPCEDVLQVWVDTGGVVAEHLIPHPRGLALCGSGVDPEFAGAGLFASRGGVSLLILELILVKSVIMELICVLVELA